MAYMIDVYSGNGVIPWDKVVRSGFKLAYLKCSEGATERDPMFQSNCIQCGKYGVKYGAYHFVTAVSGDAQWANASAFLAASELPPAIDVEEIEGVPNSLIWTRAYALLGHLLECNRIPLIYTNRDMCATLQRLPGLAKLFALCPLWLADYETPATQAESVVASSSEIAPWSTFFFRQYTAVANIGGVPDIDMSVTGESAFRWLQMTQGTTKAQLQADGLKVGA